ncbi:MAG: glycosyltransferase family A protein [Planctomycetota bacterium]
MPEAPLVHVLMPARDAAPTIATSLRSIQRQTLADFRCVVVDDGSRDETKRIVEQFADRDPRFGVIDSEQPGLIAALQHGLLHCTAKFTARMDADDVMHRDRLQAQLDLLRREPDLAGVGCHVRAFPSASFGRGLLDYSDWLRTVRNEADVVRERFVECPLLHPTWMLRTDVMRTHGYHDRGWAEDWDLLLRLLHSGQRLSVVPRVLHGWRRSERTATATDPRYSQDRMTALRAHHLCLSQLQNHASYVLWGHGDTGRRLRHALLRHDRHPEVIIEVDPRKIGQRIDGALVVPPSALARYRGLPIVVSVANAAPRSIVRQRLADLGCTEGRDFVCAA